MANSHLYPYVITLRNEHSRYVNIIGFLLSAGSAVLFLREMILLQKIVLPYLLGIVFILGLIAWNFFIYKKKDRQVYFSKALLIAGLVWTRMPYFQWLIVVFAALALLEYQAKHATEIGFSTDHIIFNQLIKKKYSWSSIDNIVLKDGLLTIDFKNNRLFQKEIDSGENEASEAEFTNWCRQQLEASHST